MAIKAVFMKVIRRCAVSLGKLFSWLLPVACTCGTQFGVMVFHYLLQLIRWLLRQTEKGVQRVATKLEMLNTPRVARACGTWCVMIVLYCLLQLICWLLRQTEEGVQQVATKLEMLNTPKDANGVNTGDCDEVDVSEDTVSDNGELHEGCSGDADTIAEDDKQHYPMVCDSDSSYDSDSSEQVIGVAVNVKEKLCTSVECTEASSPQELVITACKPFLGQKKPTLYQKLEVEEDVEDMPDVQDDVVARLAVTDNSGNRESDENSEADCLDIGEEEQFYINGVVQKSDSSGRNEVMATVQWCNNVIKDDSSFTSYVESTGEAAQEGVAGKEESIDEENQPAAPPMPYKSTAAIMANQNDHNYYETTYLTNNIDQLKLVFVCCHYRQ